MKDEDIKKAISWLTPFYSDIILTPDHIGAVYVLIKLANLYVSTARRMPEEISEIEIPAFDTKDFTVEQRARILLYISLAFRSRFVTGQNKARQECILSYAKREQELKERLPSESDIFNILDNTEINKNEYLSSFIGVSGVVRLSEAIRAQLEKGK